MSGIIDSLKNKVSQIKQMAEAAKIINNPALKDFVGSLTEKQRQDMQEAFKGLIESFNAKDGTLSKGASEIDNQKNMEKMKRILTPQQFEQFIKIMSLLQNK